jgi:hypothetical protein
VKSCFLKVCVCGGKGLSCFEAADSRFIAGRMTKVVRVTGLQVKGWWAVMIWWVARCSELSVNRKAANDEEEGACEQRNSLSQRHAFL